MKITYGKDEDDIYPKDSCRRKSLSQEAVVNWDFCSRRFLQVSSLLKSNFVKISSIPIQVQSGGLDAPAITFTPPQSHWRPGNHILPCASPGKLSVHAPAITFVPGAGSCTCLIANVPKECDRQAKFMPLWRGWLCGQVIVQMEALSLSLQMLRLICQTMKVLSILPIIFLQLANPFATFNLPATAARPKQQFFFKKHLSDRPGCQFNVGYTEGVYEDKKFNFDHQRTLQGPFYYY